MPGLNCAAVALGLDDDPVGVGGTVALACYPSGWIRTSRTGSVRSKCMA
jgi:hypothetical protein